MKNQNSTHSVLMGYILWIFGIGYIYDYWMLNDQITVINNSRR